MVLNCEIHNKVFIYVYLQFKSEFKENYLALTSLEIPGSILLLVCINDRFMQLNKILYTILHPQKGPHTYTHHKQNRQKTKTQTKINKQISKHTTNNNKKQTQQNLIFIIQVFISPFAFCFFLHFLFQDCSLVTRTQSNTSLKVHAVLSINCFTF